jgi:hypothetical protein
MILLMVKYYFNEGVEQREVVSQRLSDDVGPLPWIFRGSLLAFGDKDIDANIMIAGQGVTLLLADFGFQLLQGMAGALEFLKAFGGLHHNQGSVNFE